MSTPPDDTPELLVRVERHRAERLADLVVVGSVCCSSCCCCCCCVHAIGGVAGAAAGSAKAVATATAHPAVLGGAPEELRGVRLVNKVYWGGFVGSALMALLFGVLMGHPWESLLVVALGAPLFQLGMSVVVLPVAAAQSGPARAGAFLALRNITVGAVLGAIAGTVVFAVLGGALAALGALL